MVNCCAARPYSFAFSCFEVYVPLTVVAFGGVGLGWAGGLMQEQALGCGLPSLPHHEAEQPDCPVPRPSGLSTATRPHRSAGGRKMPSSCV